MNSLYFQTAMPNLRLSVTLCSLACVLHASASDSPSLIDKDATAETRQLYQRLLEASASRRTDAPRVISGQAGLHGRSATLAYHEDAAEASGGRAPVILAMSLDFRRDPASGVVTIPSRKPYRLARQHHQSGGIVMLSPRFIHPTHPKKGHRFNREAPIELDQLTRKPANEPRASYRQFWDQVDVLANDLNSLEQSGTPVLLRIFWEMDIPAAVFWWGGKDADAFKALWVDVVTYLRDRCDVHNAVYVFSPAGSNLETRDARFAPPAEWADVFGLTAYSDHFSDNTFEKTRRVLASYRELERKSMGKPFGFTEVGPSTPESIYDWTDFRDALFSDSNRACFFTAHNNGWALTESQKSIGIPGHQRNSNVGVFLNDMRVGRRMLKRN